jgi:hypothetical protein
VYDGKLVGGFPAVDTSSGDLVTIFQLLGQPKDQ